MNFNLRTFYFLLKCKTVLSFVLGLYLSCHVVVISSLFFRSIERVFIDSISRR